VVMMEAVEDGNDGNNDEADDEEDDDEDNDEDGGIDGFGCLDNDDDDDDSANDDEGANDDGGSCRDDKAVLGKGCGEIQGDDCVDDWQEGSEEGDNPPTDGCTE
jgi:hypothetical protein